MYYDFLVDTQDDIKNYKFDIKWPIIFDKLS